MLDNMRLKQQILLGYSVPLFLAVLVVVIIYLCVRTADGKIDSLEATHVVVHDVKFLRSNAFDVERYTEDYILVSGNNETLQKLNSAEEQLKHYIENIDHLVTGHDERNLFYSVSQRATQMSVKYRSLIELVDQGKRDEAVKQFYEYREGGRSLLEAIEKLESNYEDKQDELRKGTQEAIHLIITVIFWGTALSIIFAFISGIYISGRISETIVEATNSVSSSTIEISATVTQHEKTAAQQAAMVNETTSTVEELGASAKQSAQQAEAAASIAQKSSDMTEEGKAAVNKTVDSMNNLKERISGVADQILQLSEQTAQIGNITNLVADLASQTNMLALNAAVEAARAGEHGRGFAVVASEVRKLADQSKKSAGETNALIAEVQKATNATIMVIEGGTKMVDDTMGITQEMAEMFGSLASAASDVYQNSQQVLLNTKQQSAALSQVVTAINNINSGAKETAEGLGQTKIGIEKLNEAATNLKAIV